MLGDDSPAARGIRLRKLRHIADVKVAELSEKTGFSKASISYWENATHSGLSHKGAEKLVKVFNEIYDIRCNVGWLLLGIGEPPAWPSANKNTEKLPDIINSDSVQIEENDPRYAEIKLFIQRHSSAIIIQIKQDFVKPLCRQGDVVGGIIQNIHDNFLGKVCIIKTSGRLDVGILKKDINNKYYICYNFSDEKPFNYSQLNNWELIEIAPIIRIWKI